MGIKRIITICIMVLALGLVFTIYSFIPSNKSMVAYQGKGTALVIEGNVVESNNPPVFEDNQVLLPIDVVRNNLDKDIFWDAGLKKIIITTQDKVVKMNTDNLTAYINNKPVKLSVTPVMIAGAVYLPIDFLKDVYKIDISYNKENNVAVIDKRNTVKKLAEVIQKEGVVRNGMSIKNPILKKLKKGDKIWAFDEFEKWYKVRTEDGIVGYIKKKSIKIISVTSSTYTEESSTPGSDILRGKINLAWQQVETRTPDMSGVPKVEGLDVVSPTWFHLANKTGTVTSTADLKYTEWAKGNGYKVWALFSNDSNASVTSKILNNSNLRERVIDKILAYTKQYNLDGINVDFENMYLKDKDMFSQFMREMAPLLRQQGLVVSVDTGVPGGSDQWSKCYDRAALARAVDYVMVMTYDQHWSGSSESGSVAQYTWVENKLKETLEEVPESKLFLGLPFYIREWKEEVGSDGKVKVTQNAVLSMDTAKERIVKNKAEIQWDQESGQFFAEYKKGGATYKMWLEDEKSIDLKSSLVHKYGLAGVASWRKGFESQKVWAVLNSNLKKSLNYMEWAQTNKNKEYKFE